MIDKVLELLNCKETERELNGRKFSVCNDVNFILNLPIGYLKDLILPLENYLSKHTTNNFSRLTYVVPNDYESSQLHFSRFFLNLYSSAFSEIPRFNILTSLVIFDEYQMMPDKALIAAADELSRSGVNVIFSTSTPSVFFEEEIVNRFRNRRVVSISIVNEYAQAVEGRDCVKKGEGYYQCKGNYEVIELIEDFNIRDLDYEIIKGEDIFKVKEPFTLFVNSWEKALRLYRKLREERNVEVCLLNNSDECKVTITTKIMPTRYNVVSEISPLSTVIARSGMVNEGDKIYIWVDRDNYDKMTESTLNLLSNIKICLKHPFGCNGKMGYVNKMILKPNIDERLIKRLGEISHLMDKREFEKTTELLGDFVTVDLFTDKVKISAVPPEFVYDNRKKILYYGNDCVYTYFSDGEKCSKIVYNWLEGGGISWFKRNLAKAYKNPIEEEGKKEIFLGLKAKDVREWI
ncbi:RNA helicase [Sulfolobus sp. E5-1-F]|uniref:RNA helicase n=1 Tax=Saccharolobus sp. E5-1-F TaxID=2663019 RepID=UPI00129808D7|nr:RNA helicase [Sulfolobus sp. E5-1-F]QGA53767.1 RNA helicase [Sulfolobus sp. E5-1-F]